MTTGELESEYQLLKKNNPDFTEESIREGLFKRAMESVCDEILAERYDEGTNDGDCLWVVTVQDIENVKGRIR